MSDDTPTDEEMKELLATQDRGDGKDAPADPEDDSNEQVESDKEA